MPWRYFYATDESNSALTAILAGQDYVSASALVSGVKEYRVLLDNDNDFRILKNKIDIAKIRAIASPDRISQFGNILPDNVFLTDVYADGCTTRETETLARILAWLSKFPAGITIAQRDLDIQGSASLGTIALTLSSKYSKTYNIPINGTVSDRTLIKTVIDSTSPAATETNATCNNAMFDFDASSFGSGGFSKSSQWNVEPDLANQKSICEDRKISMKSSVFKPKRTTCSTVDSWILIDYGAVKTGTMIYVFDTERAYGGSPPDTETIYLEGSQDGVNFTVVDSFQLSNTYNTPVSYPYKTLSGSATARHVRLRYRYVCGGESFSGYWMVYNREVSFI